MDADPASVEHDDRAFENGWRYVASHAAGTVEGVFGPDSETWRIHREAVIVLGGIRALLLELAHPAVASAVARHSTFHRHYARRVVRTFGMPYLMIFGDLDTAKEVATRIHRRHHPIRGMVEAAVHSPQAQEVYRANDPALLYWVQATLVDTSMRMFESVFGPLGPRERQRFHDESLRYSSMLGMPLDALPQSYEAFEDYVDQMLSGPALRVGPTAASLWASLRDPPMPLRTITRASVLLSAGMLPPRLREGFGLSWTPADQSDHDRLLARLRQTVPRLPEALRFNMAYHHAQGRIARHRGEPRRTASVVAAGLARVLGSYL